MALTRWFRTAAVVTACASAAAGAVVWFSRERPGTDARVADADVVEVKPGTIRVAVEASGVLEAARTADVFCLVEGQTNILRVVPEGTFVAKGELVCELDGASIRDELVNQEIAVKAAEADARNASRVREIAENATKAYEQGVYRLEADAVKGELLLAQSALKLAEMRRGQVDRELKRLNDLVAESKGAGRATTQVDYGGRRMAAESALAIAKRGVDNAANKQKLLETLTKPKQLRELGAAVEQARSDEEVRQAVVENEKAKEAKLRGQLANCQILAPAEGLVLLANSPGRSDGSDQPEIEEGATVRERQKILSIAEPGGPMRVNVKLPESQFDRVVPGLPARIKVEAYKGDDLFGEVESVAPLPDPTRGLGLADKVRVYTAAVAVEGSHPGLRPSMSAAVEILVTELDDVLTVPLTSVARLDGKDCVAVKTRGGGIAWRDVILGISDGNSIEVRKGLKGGEFVVLRAALVKERPGANGPTSDQ